jgi:hypothetical protein
MAQDGLSPADLEHRKMILGGVERRAQIDTETLKALLLINGGGIVALLTFSSVLLARPGQEGFLRCIFIAIMLLAAGLVSAVLHNQCRRECSRIHDVHGLAPPCWHPFRVQTEAPARLLDQLEASRPVACVLHFGVRACKHCGPSIREHHAVSRPAVDALRREIAELKGEA